MKDSGSHVPEETASLIFGVVQMVGTTLTAFLIDRKGRKFLLALSMIGCGLGHTVMCSYLHLRDYEIDVEMFDWMPVACMSFVILSSAFGIAPLTFICLVEWFPAKLRSFGVSFGAFILNVFTFILAKIFPMLSKTITLKGCILFFSVSCIIGAIFMIVYIKETKGKDLNTVANKNENK